MHLRSARRLVPVVLAVLYLSSCKGNVAPATSTFSYTMGESPETGPPCVHVDSPYSDRICPGVPTANQFVPSQVTAETLVVRAGSRNIRIALENRTDAIFLTKSALETFLLRHYDARGDTTKARELREFIAANFH
jgi:hypothetical protein